MTVLLDGDGATMKAVADHASDFFPGCFCTRLRPAHRRRAAGKKYHLAAPGSNILAGGQTERRGKRFAHEG
jgi:hypothetical protein